MRSSVGKTCPYCQYPIKPDEPVIECSHCGMPHHRACWEYNRGCTTYGCSGVQRHGRLPVAGNQQGSDHIDLTDIMHEPEQPTPYYPQQPGYQPAESEAPLLATSNSLAGSGGVIGAIIGGFIGLSGGCAGCIPGAIFGFIIGALIGGFMLYGIIITVTSGIGYMFGSVGGQDAAIGGAAIGLIVGVIIIVIGCCKQA
ncbi:MAG: hypothetical protein GX139_04215 [Armatimonadetes bacterium]|nr:hypothetical protein [Armatimonadota bacterium]